MDSIKPLNISKITLIPQGGKFSPASPSQSMSSFHSFHSFGPSSARPRSPLSPATPRTKLRNSLNLGFMTKRRSKKEDTKIKTPQNQIFETSYSSSPQTCGSVMSTGRSISTTFTSPPYSNPPPRKASFHSATPPVVQPYIFSGQAGYGEEEAGCDICEEPLVNTLSGERKLVLQCSHEVHEECFLEYLPVDVFSPDDKDAHPPCPTCGELSMPANEAQWNELFRQKLQKARQLQREQELNELVRLSPHRTPEGADILHWPLAKEKTQAVTSPSVRPNVRIKVEPRPSSERSADLSYMSLTMEASADDYDGGRDSFINYHEQQSPLHHRPTDPVLSNLIASVSDWGRHDPHTAGPVRCVDAMDVSNDGGRSYRTLLGFLFDDLILFIENSHPGSLSSKTLFPGSVIKGSLIISRHVHSVNNGADLCIFINAQHSTELKMNIPANQDEWYHRLLQLVSGQPSEDPFCVPKGRITPLLSSPIRLATPVDSPVDLVLVIPIASCSDVQLRAVQETIRGVLASLSHLDRLALTLVGCGPGEASTFAAAKTEYIVVGFAGPEWSGWDHTIRSLADPAVRGGGKKKVTLEAWSHSRRLLEARETKNPTCAIFMISETAMSPNQEMSHPSSPTKIFALNQLTHIVPRLRESKRKRIGFARLVVETADDTIVQIFDSHDKADSHQSANGGHASFTFPIFFGSAELKLAVRGVPPTKFILTSCEGQFDQAECLLGQSW